MCSRERAQKKVSRFHGNLKKVLSYNMLVGFREKIAGAGSYCVSLEILPARSIFMSPERRSDRKKTTVVSINKKRPGL